MTFFDNVATVLAENPGDFAQAVFSRTGRPQEAKYLFIFMLLGGMMDEEMLLTEQGQTLAGAISGNQEKESRSVALMQFMCEDVEFACARIEPALSARLADGQGRLSEKSFWLDTMGKIMEQFPGREQLVRTACHIVYTDMFKCSFNEAAEYFQS